MPAPVAAADAAAAAAKKETEAQKRARRRQAQKNNKKLLKEADAEQAAKFAALDAEKQQRNGEEGGEDHKEGAAAMSDDGAAATVKREQGAATAAAAAADTEFVADAVDLSNPAMAEFAEIFQRFQKLSEEAAGVVEEEEAEGEAAAHEKSKDERIDDELREQSGESSAAGEGGETLSRRKQKLRDRLAISELKQLVAKPEVVELHDAASADPKLLVYLKSYRNSVPVPAHWCQKRKYLQNKRGFEKPPFQLPACIENTGISKMRGAQQEKEKEATNKQKQRAKMQPKMGKIDIDYQILHDAFFRYQTKPPMTEHGSLYYEGREHEIKMTDKRPCVFSQALRDALGMKDELAPPPWLIAMQRFGPPPAYPNLKIPGVSAPIPAGARYGFGEGEWGKPPVDVNGRPLYGDVFGIERKSADEEKVDTTLWGVLESEDEEDEEEEEEEAVDDDEEKEAAMAEGDEAAGTASTLSTVSGLTTPELLNLRKADGTGTETPDTVRGGGGAARPSQPQALYQVLEEKRTSVGGGMFGTSHTYVLPEAGGSVGVGAGVAALSDQERRVESLRARARGQVDVALNPDELEGLDAATLKRKYDSRLNEEQEAGKKHLAMDDDDDDDDGGKKKKRKKAGAGAEARNKVYKDFKF